MKQLPIKFSKNWLIVYGIYVMVLFVSFMLTRVVLKVSMTLPNVVAFIILSLITAAIPCFIAFFGGRTFFIVSTAFEGIAVVYMFIVIVFKMSPGWADLTSVVSFLFISMLGIIIGLVAQLFLFLLSRPKA